jgi:hypothetical protein
MLVHFSAMADAKANMMLTVCSIVLTISVTQLDSPLLRWPLVMLTLCTLLALLLAVLAVLPASSDPAHRIDPSSTGFNPLFFGHFATISLDEYSETMARLLSSRPDLFAALVKDIYGQGVVLAKRKFHLLRLSYISFLLGAILTVAGAFGTLMLA